MHARRQGRVAQGSVGAGGPGRRRRPRRRDGPSRPAAPRGRGPAPGSAPASRAAAAGVRVAVRSAGPDALVLRGRRRAAAAASPPAEPPGRWRPPEPARNSAGASRACCPPGRRSSASESWGCSEDLGLPRRERGGAEVRRAPGWCEGGRRVRSDQALRTSAGRGPHSIRLAGVRPTQHPGGRGTQQHSIRLAGDRPGLASGWPGTGRGQKMRPFGSWSKLDRPGRTSFPAQLQDGLGVHRQMRLSVTPTLPDLGEREALVVVERHDDLLPLGQRVDRLGEQVLRPRTRTPGPGPRPWRSSRVSTSRTCGAGREQLVQGDDVDKAGEDRVQVLERDPEARPRPRAPSSCGAGLPAARLGLRDLTGLERTEDPGHRDDRALDPADRVGRSRRGRTSGSRR